MTNEIELMRRGARNAVTTCMGVTTHDRVFIMSDRASRSIGELLADEVRGLQAVVRLVLLEDYAERPILALPDTLRRELIEFQPTVTFYAATGLKGEITFRIGLRVSVLQDLNVRHAHMIGITPQLMREGMNADYHDIAELTRRVTAVVRKAQRIRVTSPEGTDLTATFDPRLHWVACTGLYHEQGEWGNLPEGETFTCPATVDGVLAARVLGDFFSTRYGVLAEPIFFQISNGRVVDVYGANQALVDEVTAYVSAAENGRRVGEFAIGTNQALDHLTGNLLQDEKIPGVHIAFGDSYPHETGATWSSPIHVDVIPTDCTIVVDGRTIMVDGKFTL